MRVTLVVAKYNNKGDIKMFARVPIYSIITMIIGGVLVVNTNLWFLLLVIPLGTIVVYWDIFKRLGRELC